MKNAYKSFLIINPFGIGDVLFSTPLIRNIKENFPSAKVFYLCNKRTSPILETNPLVDKTFIYERDDFEKLKKISKILWIKKFLAFLAQIKKEKIEVALDLSLNSQFGFFAWASGIKGRVGYDYKHRGRFLTKKIKFWGYEDKHVIEYYLGLLKFLRISPAYKKMEVFLDNNSINKAEVFLKEHNINNNDLIIVIAPCGGASWGKDAFRRYWPKEKFAKLADRLIDKYGAKIIFTGAGKEKGIIEEIGSLMNNKATMMIDHPLCNFLALLSNARILIANDGGPLHMGVAIGVKTVSIFGPVSEVVYGPYPVDPQRYVVIKKDLPCRPCYKKFRLPECPYDRKCLKDISVDEVFEAVRRLIGNISS